MHFPRRGGGERVSRAAVHPAAALDAGCRFVVDSDAHYLREYGNLAYGVAQARRAWLHPAVVANTLGLDEFLSTLRC